MKIRVETCLLNYLLVGAYLHIFTSDYTLDIEEEEEELGVI